MAPFLSYGKTAFHGASFICFVRLLVSWSFADPLFREPAGLFSQESSQSKVRVTAFRQYLYPSSRASGAT